MGDCQFSLILVEFSFSIFIMFFSSSETKDYSSCHCQPADSLLASTFCLQHFPPSICSIWRFVFLSIALPKCKISNNGIVHLFGSIVSFELNFLNLWWDPRIVVSKLKRTQECFEFNSAFIFDEDPPLIRRSFYKFVLHEES